MKTEKIFLVGAIALLLSGSLISSGAFGLSWEKIGYNFSQLQLPFKLPVVPASKPETIKESIKVSSEESVVIEAIDKVSPAVVTVSISTTRRTRDFFEFDPFNPFSPFAPRQGATQKIEQDIGSGFIVSSDGLVVTNKHVVSEAAAKYRVITKEDKTYEVAKIYRDPTNDLAILKIEASSLPTVEMGDSSKIKVGQMAIAIGTALGEFRHTVTTGVISGMGRGITAGSPFAGQAERLDNVIQTDAAINPGNSGGPLINSSGQVIGVNTAVSAEGQNIGFALPINVVREALNQFNSTGQFNRPYLGVRYKIVTRDIAVLNEIPEGAYLVEVVEGGPAAEAGLKEGDIITKIDNSRLSGADSELSKIISSRKVGDRLNLTVYREDKELSIEVQLGNQGE